MQRRTLPRAERHSEINVRPLRNPASHATFPQVAKFPFKRVYSKFTPVPHMNRPKDENELAPMSAARGIERMRLTTTTTAAAAVIATTVAAATTATAAATTAAVAATTAAAAAAAAATTAAAAVADSQSRNFTGSRETSASARRCPDRAPRRTQDSEAAHPKTERRRPNRAGAACSRTSTRP